MMMDKTLSAMVNEKDVENFFRQHLVKKLPGLVFSSPLGCDGYAESDKLSLKMICEFKDDIDLSLKINQIKVLSQILYYIKKFEVSGKILPSVIFVGDRNECFTIHTNSIFKYLGMDLNWSIPPSKAHTNIELINMMMNDDKITPHIFSIRDIDSCIVKVKDINKGVTRLIPITPHNITEVFNYFESKVLGKTKLNTNEIANLFVQILINPDDNFLHPKKKNTLYTKSHKDVPIKSTETFNAFFKHFKSEYSPKEKEELTAVVDRIVQDTVRRKQGEFFTPTIWVDKAHEYIASVFGDDWKEKYVVWDPAWGTGNLTRDYRFKELYCSTLNYSDIQTANQMGYNPEATKFQYDFLNDPYEYLPEGLRHAIESGREIIVFMNPPYGRATGIEGRFSNISVGATYTKVSESMKNMKVSGSDNFYTQFLFRSTEMNLVNICSFTPSNFQTGESFKSFRKYFYDKIDLKSGFIFRASNFADVADDWSIQFSLFKKGEFKGTKELDILDENDDYNISKIGNKILVSTDNKKSLKDWVKNENGKLIDFPKLSSPFNVKESKWGSGVLQDSIATLVCNSNSPSKNGQSVYIVNGGITENVGKIFLRHDNFLDGCSVFSTRRLTEVNWINWYDEYLAPNEGHESFEQFKHESIVYSLFESKSNQSSLRQITYKDKLWDIKNQFFWMSKEEMMSLANQNNYTELYNDARTDSDRYVYNLLFGEERIYDKLSNEAKDVLDTATNLVRLSMGMRQNFSNDANHLNSWDAGYAQLKLLWKEYFPEQFKEFRQKYKVLEDKMRPMVYELGFLLK